MSYSWSPQHQAGRHGSRSIRRSDDVGAVMVAVKKVKYEGANKQNDKSGTHSIPALVDKLKIQYRGSHTQGQYPKSISCRRWSKL